MDEDIRPTHPREEGALKSLYILDVIALVLVIVGGINWGVLGIFEWNMIHAIFYAVPVVERILYVIVGVAAIYTAVVTPFWVKQHRYERPPTTVQGF